MQSKAGTSPSLFYMLSYIFQSLLFPYSGREESKYRYCRQVFPTCAYESEKEKKTNANYVIPASKKSKGLLLAYLLQEKVVGQTIEIQIFYTVSAKRNGIYELVRSSSLSISHSLFFYLIPNFLYRTLFSPAQPIGLIYPISCNSVFYLSQFQPLRS